MSPFYSRTTPRAQRYDYSSPGMYFVTICTQDRVHYFGEIRDGTMMLSDIGKICNTHIQNIPQHRKHTDIHEYVVMPNHVHILLYTDACRDPISADPNQDANPDHRTAQDAVPTNHELKDSVRADKPKPTGPSYGSLGYIINLLKGGITRDCKKQGFSFARQSRYHDKIVRDQGMYETIKYYIQTNLDKRSQDVHYTDT